MNYLDFQNSLSRESLINSSIKKVIEKVDRAVELKVVQHTDKVFEKSSAGEDTFENIFDEKEFDDVQDALKDFDLIFL